MIKLFGFAFALLAGLSSVAFGQSIPSTQCVSTAVAGGTGDAITIPQLPCTATSTLLILTLTATNSTTSPTIQQIGVSAPQVVLNGNGGGPIAAGFMATNNRVLLTYNGVNWFLLSSLSASFSGLAFVNDNAGLAAASRVAFPGSLLRLTYGNGNGAPASEWTSQVGTCVANSMVSDGGSCQNGSDGNSFKASVPPEGLDVRQFGVSLTGGDSSTALQAAFTWAAASRAMLIASAGTITWGTGISVTMPSSAWGFGIRGAGRSITNLAYTGTGCALTVNYQAQLNEAHFSDWTLTTSHAGTANGLCLSSSVGSLLSANNGTTTLERLGFQGSDGGFATNYFGTAIPVVGVDQINLTDVWIAGSGGHLGNGVSLSATNPAVFGAAQFNFQTPIFQSLSKGIYIATSNVQGIYVNQGSLSNTDNIYVDAAATTAVQGISLVNSTTSGHNGINLQPCVTAVYMAFNDMFVDSTGTALLMNKDCGAIFTGNTVAPSVSNGTGAGVSIGQSITSGGTFITNNQFYNLVTGVQLDANTNDVHIHDNAYNGTTNGIINHSTLGGNQIGSPATLAFGSVASALSAGTTYACLLGCNVTAANIVTPFTGIQNGVVFFSDLFVFQGTAPGSGHTNTFTWQCGGVPTAITTTLTNAQTVNADETNSAMVPTGSQCFLLTVIGAGSTPSALEGTIKVGINP